MLPAKRYPRKRKAKGGIWARDHRAEASTLGALWLGGALVCASTPAAAAFDCRPETVSDLTMYEYQPTGERILHTGAMALVQVGVDGVPVEDLRACATVLFDARLRALADEKPDPDIVLVRFVMGETVQNGRPLRNFYGVVFRKAGGVWTMYRKQGEP